MRVIARRSVPSTPARSDLESPEEAGARLTLFGLCIMFAGAGALPLAGLEVIPAAVAGMLLMFSLFAGAFGGLMAGLGMVCGTAGLAARVTPSATVVRSQKAEQARGSLALSDGDRGDLALPAAAQSAPSRSSISRNPSAQGRGEKSRS